MTLTAGTYKLCLREDGASDSAEQSGVQLTVTDPTCDDSVQNGDEEDVDCGGSCDACPTCSDGTQNGDETGTDCGGSCDACPVACACIPCGTENNGVNQFSTGTCGVSSDTCSESAGLGNGGCYSSTDNTCACDTATEV